VIKTQQESLDPSRHPSCYSIKLQLYFPLVFYLCSTYLTSEFGLNFLSLLTVFLQIRISLLVNCLSQFFRNPWFAIWELSYRFLGYDLVLTERNVIRNHSHCLIEIIATTEEHIPVHNNASTQLRHCICYPLPSDNFFFDIYIIYSLKQSAVFHIIRFINVLTNKMLT